MICCVCIFCLLCEVLKVAYLKNAFDLYVHICENTLHMVYILLCILRNTRHILYRLNVQSVALRVCSCIRDCSTLYARIEFSGSKISGGKVSRGGGTRHALLCFVQMNLHILCSKDYKFMQADVKILCKNLRIFMHIMIYAKTLCIFCDMFSAYKLLF